MAPQLRAIEERDLPAVTRYLAARLRGAGGEARYRRFFAYPWLDAKPSYGAMIDDGGEVRGVVGAIYADRPAGRTCNLTSIAVDPEHRGLSLKLFQAVVGQRGLAAITCFSASPEVATVLGFFRFARAASDRVIVALGGGLASLARGRARVWTSTADLDAALSPAERVIARDHRGCGQLVVERGGRRCFAITVRRGRDVRAFTEILYASDPDLLVDSLPWVMPRWLVMHRTPLAGLPARWVKTPPLASFPYTKLRPIFARGQPIDTVDGLYSELVPMFTSPRERTTRGSV